MSLILVDVEATNVSPFSGVMTEFGAVEFKSRATFHGILWESVPDPEIPAKPLVTGKQFDEVKVMTKFAQWIKQVTKGRPVMVSDNPAYDFQWINFYFDKTMGGNPLGHSARRISDFYAGLERDFYQTQKWKQYRLTYHDHNPVNDSMGNAEALQKLMEIAAQ